MKKLFALAVILTFAATGLLAGPGHDHSAKAKGDHSCPMHAEHAKGSCPMKEKKVAESTAIEMTGHLLCMHCNLQKESSCRKVFQAANDTETLYDVCPGSKADLDKAGDHGKSVVKVKGKLVKATDGTQMLSIESVEAQS